MWLRHPPPPPRAGSWNDSVANKEPDSAHPPPALPPTPHPPLGPQVSLLGFAFGIALAGHPPSPNLIFQLDQLWH